MSSLLDTQNVSEKTTLTVSQVARAANIVDILRQFQIINIPPLDTPISVEGFEVIVIDGNCIGTLSTQGVANVHVYEAGIDFDAMAKPIKNIGSDICSNRTLPRFVSLFSALKENFAPECILIVNRETGKCVAYRASESFLARLNEGKNAPFVALS